MSSHKSRSPTPTSRFSCLFHEADRRQTQPSPTQQITTPTSRFSSSRGQTDLMLSFPCLSFGSLLTKNPSCHLGAQFHHRLPEARPPQHRLAPPFSLTSFSWPLPLSELGGDYCPERGRKKKNLSVHHQCTNDEQPLTPPDTCSVHLPNNLAKHAFNGGSGLILYLITHEGPFPQQYIYIHIYI